jgi:hypothetical protein
MVVGEDRVPEFKKRITPYLNHPDKTKSFELNKFQVVSAGERDPDQEGITGVSGTKMREFAAKNNYPSFKAGVPSGLSDRFAREMFDLVRKGIKIAEEVLATRNSLNIPRNKMPQIAQRDIQHFIKELEAEGIEVSKAYLPVSKLLPTQKEVNSEKINKKMQDFSAGADAKPFLVSLDNYILDGHHQLYALKSLDKNKTVVACVVGLKMQDLLKYAHGYKKVGYKEIDE